MNKEKRYQEKGQVLVMVAILLVGMLAILALVLDGGNILLNRRQAQNASDAGALAGARTLCLEQNVALAEATAEDYAINRNGAMTADVTISNANMITVTSHITFTSFFAQFVGFDELVAEATAAAGCFPPTTGERVMPIAWICKPPLFGVSSSDDCMVQWIDEETLNDYIANPVQADGITPHPELYIIMDSSALPTDLEDMCGVDLVCDLDGDGEDDLIANGDRSWLDLNGAGGGSSSLVGWINGMNVPTVPIPTWIGGQAGVANNVFQAVDGHINEIFGIPIYDAFCDVYPTDPECASVYQTGDNIFPTAGGNYYYRIYGFAAFVPTCVDAPGVTNPTECPGHAYVTDHMPDELKDNIKTIEGYFITGILSTLTGGGPSSGGLDLGVYNLRLFK